MTRAKNSNRNDSTFKIWNFLDNIINFINLITKLPVAIMGMKDKNYKFFTDFWKWIDDSYGKIFWRIILYTRCRKIRAVSFDFSYICVKSYIRCCNFVTRKVDLLIYSLLFSHEKRLQINFSHQEKNISAFWVLVFIQ